MKSAVLIAGASLLFAGFEGALASSNPQPPCTVTKSCTAISKCTVTNTCTVKVPDPTTVVKNNVCTVTSYPDPVTVTKVKVCTSTVVKSKTLTKCFDHIKTQTEYFPKYTTKTATVTVVDPPKCTPAPAKPCCLATQQQHVVEEGDDFLEIAALYNTTVSTLFQDNAFLTETSQLEVGDILCVPSVESDDLVEKRDAAHFHHHHHHPSCDEAPEDPLCDPPKKHHHHHHGHKHHHHKHHKHHGHHKHNHHHQKPTKTKTQIQVVSPRPDLNCDEDTPIHCGLCHAWHNVWPGDTASSIAKRYRISHGEVLHLNPWIGNGDKLQEGDWVCVAGCDVPIRFDPVSSDAAEECAPEHICVPCARPGVCARSGKHASCPENHSCEKKA
ncbi:hypothetical protein F503_06130 [Ophiostoma piceae UAMH 11346]|uniref:LysM domain-containing protein n=1 Tax=Ophiostoma piceae (strain UAMH 11346) TaxID=1262450 RepID=S3BLX5_OPHP1|nr:hypothetical protein F503_06130 [Ophiostoma piceae UAMH 11346]